MEARWHALEPADAARILTATRVPWWLAGGWALDHWDAGRGRTRISTWASGVTTSRG